MITKINLANLLLSLLLLDLMVVNIKDSKSLGKFNLD